MMTCDLQVQIGVPYLEFYQSYLCFFLLVKNRPRGQRTVFKITLEAIKLACTALLFG